MVDASGWARWGMYGWCECVAGAGEASADGVAGAAGEALLWNVAKLPL